MKGWGLAVAGLYVAALVVLTVPVGIAAFGLPTGADAGKMFSVYLEWPYWMWIGIMFCGAWLLLFVPVRDAERRLRSRRPLLVPVATAGFFLAALFLCAVAAVVLVAVGKDGENIKSAGESAFWTERTIYAAALGLPLLFWLAWGAYFHRLTRADTPEALSRRAASHLLGGSILELLVAVPCHVIVRRREDCCAPFGTFIGIAAGLSVMLISFGPGVFFLFADRCRRLRAKTRLPQAE